MGWPPFYGMSLSASFHSLELVVAKHLTLKASNIELRGMTSMIAIAENQSAGVKMGEFYQLLDDGGAININCRNQ
eukprot:scaffold74999_cov61-Cyclotella_meneghiniana.AAC.2